MYSNVVFERRLKVTGVTCHVLLDPAFDVARPDSAQDDIVVEVHTDEGITGIGETDLNAWVARELIEAPGMHAMDRGLAPSLIGLDPQDPRAIWEQLYVSTAMTGRRGAGIHALGAIDMALWDIRGKAAGQPTWQLLADGAAAEHLVPYASLLPAADSVEEIAPVLLADVRAAIAQGFRAAKLELLIGGPYGEASLEADAESMTEIVAGVRELTGPDFTIMVDVGYAWGSATQALEVLEQWRGLDVFFIETPLWSDDLAGLSELVERSPVPVAAGEWLATRHEFRELLDSTGLQVLQPDVGRVGGLTEAMRVCDIARDSTRTVVPHGWKTGITVAATAHLAAARPEVAFFEFLPADQANSALRRDLVVDELALGPDGTLPLPTRPGLGVDVDREALDRFAEGAEQFRQDRSTRPSAS